MPDLLACSGAGRTLLPHEISAEVMRTVVRNLLTDPDVRAASVVVAEQIAAMPPPEAVAANLRASVHPNHSMPD